MLSVFHHSENVLQVREHLKEKYSKYYIGWDNEVDALFDLQTIWFVMYANDKINITATCRLVFWNQDNKKHLPLSFHLADQINWSYPTEPRIQVEGTGLTFTNKQDLLTLMYSMFFWLDRQDIDTCYSLFDPLNNTVS